MLWTASRVPSPVGYSRRTTGNSSRPSHSRSVREDVDDGRAPKLESSWRSRGERCKDAGFDSISALWMTESTEARLERHQSWVSRMHNAGSKEEMMGKERLNLAPLD